jgi:hypothetical protein
MVFRDKFCEPKAVADRLGFLLHIREVQILVDEPLTWLGFSWFSQYLQVKAWMYLNVGHGRFLQYQF